MFLSARLIANLERYRNVDVGSRYVGDDGDAKDCGRRKSAGGVAFAYTFLVLDVSAFSFSVDVRVCVCVWGVPTLRSITKSQPRAP